MKEQTIVVEIAEDGSVTADADGFTGDACMRDLERLLAELGMQQAEVVRKPDKGEATRRRVAKQQVGKKS